MQKRPHSARRENRIFTEGGSNKKLQRPSSPAWNKHKYEGSAGTEEKLLKRLEWIEQELSAKRDGKLLASVVEDDVLV